MGLQVDEIRSAADLEGLDPVRPRGERSSPLDS
jgi:hypothetical protein